MSLLDLIKNNHSTINTKILNKCINNVSQNFEIDKKIIKRIIWRNYGWFTTEYINNIFEKQRQEKQGNVLQFEPLDKKALLLLLSLFKPLAIKIGNDKSLAPLEPIIEKMNEGLSYQVIPTNLKKGDQVIDYFLNDIADLFYSDKLSESFSKVLMDIIFHDAEILEFVSWIDYRNHKYFQEYKFAFETRYNQTKEQAREHRRLKPIRIKNIINNIINYP